MIKNAIKSQVERETVSSDDPAPEPVILRKQEKIKHRWWNGISYSKRMAAVFAGIACMTVLVAMVMVFVMWTSHFQEYTAENLQAIADSTAPRIAARYEKSGTLWDADTLDPAIAVYESNVGTGVKVIDARGNTPFDSSNPLLATTPPGEVSGLALEPRDASHVAISSIVVDGQVVGSLHLWSMGSEPLMRQIDKEFRDKSFQALLIAAAVAVILASLLGLIFARRMVTPINRITRTANAIKEGDLSARTKLHGDDEISRMGMVFDEMAETLEKDHDLERRLTTDVAHELRTPLMAIQATVEAMVDGVFEADSERLSTVSSEVQRLSRLVDALLKLSRLENRSHPMKEEIVDVGEVISGIISTHEAFVTDAGLTFSYSAQDSVLVVGDPDLIRQATANLISNAVRYTPEGGHISITVKKGDIMASIAVRDTGIGLTPEEARMVFQRFWRSDAGRNRESGGLGIGLAVVKEIVDRHGGWVQVEGRKGEGACFTIHIPLYDAERSEKIARANAKAKTKSKVLSNPAKNLRLKRFMKGK